MLKDFYPTPSSLIYKMFADLDFDKVHSILEPSAGKGDICDHIKKKTEYGHRTPDIDVIEIEQDLQHILKGKEYNLIYDDFLKFNSDKQYDLIVANFPFSDGDQHLKKAISILEKYGGDLVCLVNAETLKNPYTSLRKVLVRKLASYKADIDYLKEEFTNAERKTLVEVALIKVHIEKEETPSLIIDDLEKAEKHEQVFDEPSQVVDTDFIKALIARFNLEVRAGVKFIEEYNSLQPLILNSIPKKGEDDKYATPLIELKIRDASSYNNDYVNEYLKGLRRKYWSALIQSNRFNKRYTSNVIKELGEKLTQLERCDFNEFNISKLKSELEYNLVRGIENAIVGMFDDFTHKYHYLEDFGDNLHYYNGWKTNKAYRVNKKIILPVNGFSSYSYSYKNKLDDYYVREKISDMVKAFNYLAGEVDDVSSLVGKEIEVANVTEHFRNRDFYYFTATFYKKGTCHITFKDQKLLDKFNIFGSRKKGWLPPSYGKKTYSEMNQEERRVVDEFQGKEEYQKVIDNKDYYLVETNQLMLDSGVDGV